jgi:hypothetical protein
LSVEYSTYNSGAYIILLLVVVIKADTQSIHQYSVYMEVQLAVNVHVVDTLGLLDIEYNDFLMFAILIFLLFHQEFTIYIS